MDDLQEMESALWRLEEQLQVIENDMAIQSHDFHEQVNSLLDPNNEEYAYLDQNSASAPSTTEAEPETSPPLAGKMQKMRAMQSTINEMDSEIRELGDEAAGLVTRYSELKEAITKAREDDKQYAADIVAIQDRLHALEKKRESDDEHIRTLEAAVNAYRESVLNSPPASPAPAPSFEHVLPLIEEKVIEIMQQAVREHGHYDTWNVGREVEGARRQVV
ncbi:hypothetical protein VNI00_003347 [Paramarasmius palmivorus]|uniref:Uncharacterized protein n=1 Tax=Paramarasmius palmivorus TaxID=297713 RepID=A0AAW0DTB7_9AGAR